MKPVFKLCLMMLILAMLGATRNKASAQEASVSYQTFYDDLSPYGQWIDNPEYGYVWHPGVDGFRPYSSGGHWVWTDEYGWMWASDFDWGWAPFHYGRWLYDDFYGWVWIPGYEWSPAWVEWREGGDYYGWAPLGPGVNINLNFSFGRYSAPYDYWCFVPRNYIMSPRVYDYCVPQSRNTIIINNTTIINNYRRTNNVFVTGPDRRDVERYTGRINPFVVRESRNAGRVQFGRNTVSVFRPRVQGNEDRRFAPRNFERYNRGGNNFQRRDEAVANGNVQRRNGFERRDNQASDQRDNGNVFQRRQQEQRNIEQQRQENRNAIERRQNEMRQQQQQRNDEQRRNMFEQRQNQMRQQQQQRNDEQRRNMFEQRQNPARQQPQRQMEPRQRQSDQQRNNSFQQRQQDQQGNGNGRERGRGRHN